VKRVLIATSRDWTGVARLPSTLGPAGFEIHLLDRGDTNVAASRWLTSHKTVNGPVEKLVARLLDVAGDYDRVIACDEPLLMALVAADDARADAFLPAAPGLLAVVLDKTRFPSAAASAGIRMSGSVVAADTAGVAEAFAQLGGPVFVKGRHGLAGAVVRNAEDASAAVAAADALGYPVLLERSVEGRSCLMPCLFERGVPVAVTAFERLRLTRAFGPSTVNARRAVEHGLLRAAQRAGLAFGLHGFVSVDYFDQGDGSDPIVLEINPRPVPQLHLGRSVGVDMAAALRDVMTGGFDGTPRIGTAGRDVALFPQELQRLRAEHGTRAGTLRWLRSPGALADVPWNDLPLAWRHLRRKG
jgi:hypothetical protein